MTDIIIIYNFAQKYRTAIFCEIDKEWKCSWIFGRNNTDIKDMDISILKDAIIVENKGIIGPFYYQKGVYESVMKSSAHTLIILGEPYNLSTWAIAFRNFFRKTPKKLIFWSHGWYGKETKIKRIFKYLFFNLANKVLLYGNYAKDVAISQGFPADKLAVIHNSLDHKAQLELRKKLKPSDIYENHFGNTSPVLIFIGRLTEVKRLDLLIDAVSILKNNGKKYNIVFVGDGKKRSELEKLVEEKGLEKQVWFYGACYDDTHNAQLIYDADLCVAPGNVGLTAMHSMVFGTPVLTHDDFPLQMPEFEAIIPGETGAFFKYNDLNSLADSISNWTSNNYERREEIRRKCYEEIDGNWTPEFQIKVLKEIV